ncbi:MAG: hypothetical protein CFK52_07035 [Chloracidobacterium sp. CP2_5A]|nr:MAG: hypothetical protein CFK52_07035 [Chloracidobacterium sp. CP2_5A]
MTPPKSRHPFLLVATAMAIVAAFYLAFGAAMLARYGGFEKDFGWRPKVGAKGYVLVAEREALRPLDGSLILAINGDDRLDDGARGRVMWLHLRDVPTEQPYTLRLARNGAIEEVALTAARRWTWDKLWQSLSYGLVSLSFAGLALFLAFLRPEDTLARLGALAALATAAIPYFRMLEPAAVYFSPHGLAAFYSVASSYPIFLAIGFHFYARFPSGAPLSPLWRGVTLALYVAGAALALGYRWLDWATLQGKELAIKRFARANWAFHALDSATLIYMLAGFVGIVVVLTRNYRRLTEPGKRRRVAWAVYGALAGVIPFASLVGVEIVFDAYRSALATSAAYRGLTFASEIAPVAMPVTLGYAIIRHRLFDARVIIRRGVQYALAQRALTILVAAPLAWLALRALLNTELTIRELFLENPLSIALGIAGALGLRFRASLQQWIDRRFFRDQYDRERLLVGLMEQLQQQISLDELTELVKREVSAALRPKTFRLSFLSSSVGQVTLIENSQPSRYLDLPERSPLAKYMQLSTGPQEAPLPPEAQLSAAEVAILEQAQAVLIVPMKDADGRLVGLMLLGEKQSEEPYSARDRQILQAMAKQVGIIHDNALLKARVDRVERMRREVLARLDEQSINLVKECPACGRCYDANANLCADDRAELTLALPVERVIEGKYRLDKLLGKGGMGAVYLAHDLRLNRPVAVKVILAHLFGDPAALRRFEREARVAAALRHPNLVAIYDFGRTGADGAYLVMEVVNGRSLRAELRRLGVLDGLTAAAWFDQVFEGIKSAHAAGIVHRDLKPENIVVCRADERLTLVKVLDFGLAKSNADDGYSITRPGMVMGTVGYMAPEQSLGYETDARSDLFSLAAMLAECLTGDTPFPRRSFSEYVIATRGQEPRLPLGAAPEAKALERILKRALASAPERRYATVGEFQGAVIPALRAYAAATGAIGGASSAPPSPDDAPTMALTEALDAPTRAATPATPAALDADP